MSQFLVKYFAEIYISKRDEFIFCGGTEWNWESLSFAASKLGKICIVIEEKIRRFVLQECLLKKGTLNAGQTWISMKINQWTEIVAHVNARILELSISF